MPSVVQIAVDPYLLCLPNPCHSAQQIEGFVQGLLVWAETLRRGQARVLVSDGCRTALLEDGQYPYGHRLRELLRQFDVDVADHKTICDLVSSVLDRTPSLEDEMGVRCVLYDAQGARIEPEALLQRLGRKTRLAFAEMLFVLSSRYICGPPCAGRASIASMAQEQAVEEHVELGVSGELAEVEWLDDSFRTTATFPAQVAEVFHLFGSHQAFRRHCGAWQLWDNAESEQGAIDAIEETIADLVRSGLDERGRTPFRLGSKFLETARQWGFGARSDLASVLIESCARIVLAQPKNALNEFRVTANSDEQRTRSDGALAYRTHLTKKGPGFRLMLWRLPGGGVEFANVGDKDELEIH
jgi:hypothetical protein